MAFVTCDQFKKSKKEQDKSIEALKSGTIYADEALLDKSSGLGGGKVTVEKIKSAINFKEGFRSDENGVSVNPADFIDNNTIVIDPTTGKIKVKPKTCVDMTNGDLNTLSNGLGQSGVTCFYGRACGAMGGDNDFIIGVPSEPNNATATSVPPAMDKSELKSNCIDVTGYQVASPNEIIQYFYDDNPDGDNGLQNSGWVRMHSGGLNLDGTLKNGNWTAWERAKAIPDPDGSIAALVRRVVALEQQLNRPCSTDIKLKASDYTPTIDDQVLVFTGGQTVNFEGDTVVGKQWTIINDSDNALTLASSGEIISPYKGSLKVKGKNAVVTVIKTADNQYRVFGQTEV